MATGAAVAVVAGTVITMKAQQKEAEAQARAARQNAQAKREQALELLDRLDINSAKLLQEGAGLKAKQLTAFASRGIDVGSGAPLSVVEETNSLITRQLLLDKKEAEFKARQLESGAEADTRLAGDIESSARLRSLGTFLSGAGKAASAGAA